MRFPRQEYWSGYPFSSPGDLPDSGTKPRSPTLQADFLLSEPDMQNHQVTSIKTCFKEIVSTKGKAIVYIWVFLYHFLNSKVWRTLTQTWIASSKWTKECTSVPGTANCIVPSPWNRHKYIFFLSLSLLVFIAGMTTHALKSTLSHSFFSAQFLVSSHHLEEVHIWEEVPPRCIQ